MTPDEMIEVVQAFKDGKEIQARYRSPLDNEPWESVKDPFWNFSIFDYRAKPDLWVVNVLGGPESFWEISVVKDSNYHGKTFYGWYNNSKIYINSINRDPGKHIQISSHLFNRSLEIANDVCNKLNNGEDL